MGKLQEQERANEEGTFNISVKPDSFYILEISFLSFKVEDAISSDDANSSSIFLGRVDTTAMQVVLGI